MKTKYKVLVGLAFDGGYHATIYNKLGGYYEDKYFMFYTKKEVLYLLRHEHNVIVSRGF